MPTKLVISVYENAALLESIGDYTVVTANVASVKHTKDEKGELSVELTVAFENSADIFPSDPERAAVYDAVVAQETEELLKYPFVRVCRGV